MSIYKFPILRQSPDCRLPRPLHILDFGHTNNIVLSKGKAVPLQAWSGPEDSSKLWFPGFMKTAQDCDKVVSLTNRPPLPPGNTPCTHFC
jgi:hypothetical protein